jgi:hypothetical protein
VWEGEWKWVERRREVVLEGWWVAGRGIRRIRLRALAEGRKKPNKKRVSCVGDPNSSNNVYQLRQRKTAYR